MGYELNKLMKQYGVRTPGAINYSGAAAPGPAPTPPELIVPLEGKNGVTKALSAAQIRANQEATDKYNADKVAFDEAARKYLLDQKSFDVYKTDYQNRLQNTPMYLESQFDTGNRPVSDAMRYVTNPTKNEATGQGMGIAQYQQNLRNYVEGNPYASTADIRNMQKPWGVSNQDVYDATGSYWGNQLSAPTYGAVPLSIANQTQQNKAAYYKQQRDLGYTDADLRAAATKSFGELPDADWAALVGTAYPTKNIAPPTENIATPTNTKLGGTTIQGFKMPDAWDSFTAPQKIDWFNANQVNPETILAGGGVQADIDWMRNNGYKYAQGGSVRNLAKKYNVGGAVRKFNIGGNEGAPEDAMEALIRERSASMGGQPPVMLANAPTATATDAAPVTASPAVQPVTPPPSATTPVSPAANDLIAMMGKHLNTESTYGPELAAARKRVTAENAAFQDMITKAMQPDSAAPDKAEMYFRLAAAFGAPTKTGHFTENLAMVGKELGEYAKDVRASKKADKQLRLQLGLEAQKLKSQAAKEELTTLRTLAGEEMRDKRDILKEYIKTGMPQSEAGKAAKDMGLTPGSKEYNDYVKSYVERKLESGELYKQAMLAVSQGQLALAQSREGRATQAAAKLTAPELKLKSEAEDALGAIGDAMSSLSRAYSLNPNTFDGTLASIAQQKILEQTDPKDPRVLATREQQNLLSKGAIANLRTAFGGNPTEGERKALLDLEGIDAKSKEERAIIMKNTYRLLKRRQEREQKRLNDITSGLYRTTTPIEGGAE